MHSEHNKSSSSCNRFLPPNTTTIHPSHDRPHCRSEVNNCAIEKYTLPQEEKQKAAEEVASKGQDPQQPSEEPQRHGAVTAAIMITESRHYYESTERRDFTEDVTFPLLFSQNANEHRARGCTGRGQKKRSRQARGNTNTEQKRKHTKTLRMISTAYNNVAACKNL